MALLDNAWYIYQNEQIQVWDGTTANNASGATLVYTNASIANIPAGATIVVVVNEATATASGTLTDNAAAGANTYNNKINKTIATGTGWVTMFVAENINALAASKTITYTKQTSGSACTMHVAFLVGVAAASYDSATAASTNGTTASATVTSGTPAVAGEVFLGFVGWNNAGALTITEPAGFVVPFTGSNVQHTASGQGGYWHNPGISPVTFAPTISSSANEATLIAGFKPLNAVGGYSSVTEWTNGATKTAGQLVRQKAPVSQETGNGITSNRVFVCVHSLSGTAVTGASEPAFTVTRGAKTTDNTNITWQEVTGVAALNGDLTNTPTWTTYRALGASSTLGQVIQSNNGHKVLICTTAGTMAGVGSEPSWAAYTTAGAVTNDGASAVWTTLQDSDTGGAPVYTIWNSPFMTIEDAFISTWGAAGNTFFVAAAHMEWHSIACGFPIPTSITAPSKLLSVLVSPSQTPPVAADLSAGAAFFSTGSNGTFTYQPTSGTFHYVYGLSFTWGANGSSTNNSGGMNFTMGSGSRFVHDNCTFAYGIISGNAAAALLQSGDVIWNNCTLSFAGVGQFVQLNAARWIWSNTANALLGTVPTQLIEPQGSAYFYFDGVDLSSLNTTLFNNAAIITGGGYGLLRRCKLNASVTIATAATSSTTSPATLMDAIDCDSAATTYKFYRNSQWGILTTNIVVTRTGGASPTGTPLSWAVALSAFCNVFAPFDCPIIGAANTVISPTARTVTVYGIINAAAIPTFPQAWIEVEYHGSASTPLASFAGTPSNALQIGANATADTSAWDSAVTARQNSHAYSTGDIMTLGDGAVWFCTSGGTSASSQGSLYNGAVDGTVVVDSGATFRRGCRFKITQAVTAQLAGQINTRVRLAGPVSTTVYIDPQPTLT